MLWREYRLCSDVLQVWQTQKEGLRNVSAGKNVDREHATGSASFTLSIKHKMEFPTGCQQSLLPKQQSQITLELPQKGVQNQRTMSRWLQPSFIYSLWSTPVYIGHRMMWQPSSKWKMIIYEFTVWVLWAQLTYLRRRWLMLTRCLRGTWRCIWTTGSRGCTQDCVNISTHPMKTRYVPVQRWPCAGVTGARVANELSKVPPPDENTQSRLLACETMKKLFEEELNADYVLFKSGSVFERLGYKAFEKSDTYPLKRFYGVKSV